MSEEKKISPKELASDVKWWGDAFATRTASVKEAEKHLEEQKRQEDIAKQRFKEALYKMQHAFEDTEAQLEASRENVAKLGEELSVARQAPAL